eukprot:TRINITY_DN103828_c0_g1_i1.p1 TRINITY_DN103828_c0_g1~~TRINITY_DN103828_c0_g1_i1.p1  ORF type:complete len:173 (-),score=26.87 TRINITY_DN103828_c0_g1_i1:68-586(-)
MLDDIACSPASIGSLFDSPVLGDVDHIALDKLWTPENDCAGNLFPGSPSSSPANPHEMLIEDEQVLAMLEESEQGAENVQAERSSRCRRRVLPAKKQSARQQRSKRVCSAGLTTLKTGRFVSELRLKLSLSRQSGAKTSRADASIKRSGRSRQQPRAAARSRCEPAEGICHA